MKNILIEICSKENYTVAKNAKGIMLEDLLEVIANGDNIVVTLTKRFSCSKSFITRLLKSTFPDRHPIKDTSIRKFLLTKYSLKRCNNCQRTLSLSTENFYTNNAKKDGFFDSCKDCSKQARINSYRKDPQKEIASNIKRELKNQGRTLDNSNSKEIEEFYRNRPEGYHVDHIIPLNGKHVSGLHVLNNLQYLSASENLAKKNKYSV